MQKAEVPQLLASTICYAFSISSDTCESCIEPNLLSGLAENFYACFVGFVFCQADELNQLKAELVKCKVQQNREERSRSEGQFPSLGSSNV